MRILICDDEERYVEDVRQYVGQYMRERRIRAAFTVTTDPCAFMQSDAVYDLAFLDIQMEGFDGIAVAKELRRRNGKVILFFITAFDEYQDDAMDLHVLRFFEKPFDEQRMRAGLDKAMEYLDEVYVDVYLNNDGGAQRILIDDILLVKTENRKTYVLTKDGEYVTNGSLDDWQKQLSTTFFYRVHKSYLVNLHYVTEYRYRELFLEGDVRVPISTRRQADVHQYWFLYLKRR